MTVNQAFGPTTAEATDLRLGGRGNSNSFDILPGNSQARWSDPVPRTQMSQGPYAALARVIIKDNGHTQRYCGTAWFVGAKTLVTAAHVLMPSTNGYRVAFGPSTGGRKFPRLSDVQYEIMDNGTDLAVLRLVEGRSGHYLRTSPFSGQDQVLVMGMPLGPTNQDDSYSVRQHAGPAYGPIGPYISYNIDTHEGQSGGPILTDRRTAVGIHVNGPGTVNLDGHRDLNAGLAFTNSIISWIRNRTI